MIFRTLNREFGPARGWLYPLWVWIAAIIGIAGRALWIATRHTTIFSGEPFDIAIAISNGRGYADTFFAGQGASAHLLPIGPLMASFVYNVAGVNTGLSKILLISWSILVTSTAFFLTCSAFWLLGISRRARNASLAFLFVAPIYFPEEAVEWSAWEGGLSVCLVSLVLLITVGLRPVDTYQRVNLPLIAIPSLAFITNPIAGVTAFCMIGLSLWQKRPRPTLLKGIAAGTAAFLIVLTPWVARNCVSMHKCILLRDNLGLELAMGNYPEAMNANFGGKIFYDRLNSIQPYHNPVVDQKFITDGGEIAYSDKLGDYAKVWIQENKVSTIKIWIRHLREIVFTSPWQFEIIRGGFASYRSMIVSLIATLALLRLFTAAILKEYRYKYAAVFLFVPIFLYIPFQPVARYCWLIYPPMVCLASDLIFSQFKSLDLRSFLFKNTDKIVKCKD